MEIKQFSRAVCKSLAEEVTEALEPLAKKYGLTLENGSGSFTPASWTKKIIFKVGDDEVQRKAEEKRFKELASYYDLEPDDYGKTIQFAGKPYKIIGIRTKASKRPVQIQRYDGKIFVTSADEVRRKLGRKDSYESITLTSKDIGTLNLSDLED